MKNILAFNKGVRFLVFIIQGTYNLINSASSKKECLAGITTPLKRGGAMKKEYQFIPAKGFVHVQHLPRAKLTYDALIEQWQSIADVASKGQYRKVLIEGKKPQRALSTTDIYRLSQHLMAVGIRGFRIAFLFYEYVTDELSDFWETVTSNTGNSVAFFTDRAEAFTWLEIPFPETTKGSQE
jgi:hypothetical protein